MVSEKKKKILKELKKELPNWSVIGIIDMYKLPARQLFQIKQKLLGKAVIRMVKKRILKRALDQTDMKNIDSLENFIQGSSSLLLSNQDPFKLARIIEQSKSPASAKPGDTAPRDIEVKSGPTPLQAGPVIGEFKKAKIPATVKEGKIAVAKDTVVAREGEEIPEEVTGILSKLGIEPMEIGLNLVAAWEDGTVYKRDVLFIPQEKYLGALTKACQQTLNLTVNTNYPTPQNIDILLSKASREARSLALDAGIPTPDTVGRLLSQAQAQAETLKSRVSK